MVARGSLVLGAGAAAGIVAGIVFKRSVAPVYRRSRALDAFTTRVVYPRLCLLGISGAGLAFLFAHASAWEKK